MKARRDWVAANQFNPHTDAEVLQAVLQRTADLSKQNQTPVIVFDLDSTLYDVAPRNLSIFREWANTPVASDFPNLKSGIEQLEMHQIGYSLMDTLNELQIKLEGAHHHPGYTQLKNYWTERFFSNGYLMHDNPYPQAAEFANDVFERGAKLLYLTGRDIPRMMDGTLHNLKRDGFPLEPGRTEIMLKEAAHVPDLAHKQNAQHRIREMGTLVASFENEPVNLVGIAENFPEAMHIFVETICSDHPAPLHPNLYRIKTFGVK
jgi:hypothetical protein